MNAGIIEFPSICLCALYHGGYDACGVNPLQPAAFYAGNFWWAHCDHVASLPRFYHINGSLKIGTYFWRADEKKTRLKFLSQCVYSIFDPLITAGDVHDCKLNVREILRDKLIDHMKVKTFLRSKLVSKFGNDTFVCISLRHVKSFTYVNEDTAAKIHSLFDQV
eukprot:gene6364-8764_t